MPRRALSFLLLTILAVNIAGLYPVFLFQQNAIREAVAERIAGFLPDQELERIVISGQSEDIQWESNQKEFWRNGRLYDLVRMESNGDSCVYYCLQDYNEAGLIAKFGSVAGDELASQSSSSPVIKLLKLLSLQEYLSFPSSVDFKSVASPMLFAEHTPLYFPAAVSIDPRPPRART